MASLISSTEHLVHETCPHGGHVSPSPPLWMDKGCSIARMDHICLYMCLLVDIWVFSYLLEVVNIASLNMCVQVFVWTPVFISFGHVPRSGFAWSCGNSVFNFSKNCIQLCLTSWRTFPSITRGKRVLARSPVFARI